MTRWALRDAWLVARTRAWDALLLLVSIAVAYLLRGATRHETLASLRDALWFVVALGFFLCFVFAGKALGAFRRLRSRWIGDVKGAPERPSLHFEPTGRFPIAATRCDLIAQDGTHFHHEWHGLTAENYGLGPIAYFPATFIPANEGDGPGGEYRAEWCWKEKPSDGWIRAWQGRFDYDPLLYRTAQP